MRALLIVSLLSFGSFTHAACPGAQPAGTDCVEPSASKQITAHSACRNVTNGHASGLSLMIPVNTSTDWSTFYTNPPAGVTAGSCGPTVASVAPYADIAVGGKTVTVTGTNFVNGATVRINGTNCTTSTYVSATSMTCVVPAATAGTIAKVNVAVVNPDTTTGTLTNGFYYVGAPRTWLKADAGITITSSRVSAWADQSGSGNNAIQYTAGQNPTLVASSASFANQPVVNFDGSQLLEFATSTAFRNVAGASAVMAIRPVGVTNDQNLFHYWSGVDGNPRFAMSLRSVTGNTNAGSSPSGDFYLSATRADGTAFEYLRGGTQSAGTPTIVSGVINFSARTAELVINGTTVSTSSTLLTAGSTSNTDSQNALLGANDGYQFYNGDMAELFLYGVTLTTAQRQVLEDYIRQRYGLP